MATRAEVLAEIRSSSGAAKRLLWRNQTLNINYSAAISDPLRTSLCRRKPESNTNLRNFEAF